jgi:hypothetical protein
MGTKDVHKQNVVVGAYYTYNELSNNSKSIITHKIALMQLLYPAK